MAVLAGAFTACGGDEQLEGSITITGSSTLRPTISAVSGRFAVANPLVTFDVDAPGTADGFTLFCDGLADINGASRPITERELLNCETTGVEFVELTIGLDAIVLLTSVGDDQVACLSTEQTYALTGPESRSISTWEGVGALAAEITGSPSAAGPVLPGGPVTVVGPGNESGTLSTFIDLAVRPLAVERDTAVNVRPDWSAQPSDALIVNKVITGDNTVGVIGFTALPRQLDIIKTVAIDAGDGCVEAGEATISDGSYPLTRELYLYVAVDANGEADPTVAGLVDYMISDEGIGYATAAGGSAPSEQAIAETRATWAARTSR